MNTPAELFRTLITMSITGGVIAAVLFAIKPLTKKRLPKTAQYYLWLTVLLALVIPFSRLVVLPANTPASTPINDLVTAAIVLPETPIEQPVWTPVTTVDTSIPADRPTVGQPAPQSQPFDWQRLIPVVPAVSGIILLYTLAGYFRFTARIRRVRRPAGAHEADILARLCGTRRVSRLYHSEAAATPMLIGLLRPVIVLPERDFTDAQLQSVLLHELTHLRRLDICIKWLSTIACALHWFNPLAWLARRELDRACELSCDEAVIRGLDADGKQCYGDTLIAVASDDKTPRAVLSTTMCERKRTLKERLGAIMEHKKHTKLAVIMSAVLIAAAVLASCALGVGRGAEVDTPEDTPPIETSDTPPMETPDAAPVKTPDAPIVSLPDGLPVHTDAPNPRHGYKIPLPESYDGNTLFGTEAYSDSLIISVFHAASRGEYEEGWLFSISRYTTAQFEQNVVAVSDYRGREPFASDDEFIYVLETPTETQSSHEEYWSLTEMIPQIRDDFMEANNLATYDFLHSIYMQQYSFPGEHMFFDVVLTNDTRYKLAMSQPVRQGEGGIWCVDRIFNDFFRRTVIPYTELTMAEYYAAKQADVDILPRLRLRPAEEVAWDYLRGWLPIESVTFAGTYDPDYIPPPQYTEQEIADAQAVVEAFFATRNAKDNEAFNKLHTTAQQPRIANEFGTQFTDIEIQLAPNSFMRDSYLRYGSGAYNGTLPNDCIVFECSFNVNGANTSAWGYGRIYSWNIILIRANAESPWLIDGEGY